MKSREVAVGGNREHCEQLSAAGTLGTLMHPRMVQLRLKFVNDMLLPAIMHTILIIHIATF